MITIRIAEAERDMNNIDESWINQQINRRRADGLSVCVRVIVREDDLNLILSTPTCSASGGSGRPLQPREKAVFDFWNKCGLSESDFTAGDLIGFLRKLRHFCK